MFCTWFVIEKFCDPFCTTDYRVKLEIPRGKKDIFQFFFTVEMAYTVQCTLSTPMHMHLIRINPFVPDVD